MIPILYGELETDFDSNGIGMLSDVISCYVEEELNGQYELTMQYPVTGIHFADIVNRAIILAKPNPVADPQPFRIYHNTKPMGETVTFYARHIAYDLMGITVSPFSATGVASALQDLKTNATTTCPFEFWTDKSSGGTMTTTVPKSIWTLLGNSEGSILDNFGGEYEFDHRNIKLYGRRGANRGVSIRYGKNLTSVEQDENCANCYTGVHPYWANEEGQMVELPEKIVNAPGNYSYTRNMPLDLSQEWEEAPTEDDLRARAEKYIADNNIGTPTVSWKVEFVQLEMSEEYKGQAILERVLIGDTVLVEFQEMGISAFARAVAAKYNSILERYESTTLGSVKANLATTIAEQQQAITRAPTKTQVQAIAMQLTARILGARGGAVRLLDTDGDGMPDELYVADNADPVQAVKVWRWNYIGWAGSKTGYNGPFALGATLEDGLLAEAVTAAKLVAGTIQSADGETFFLDLDNGILRIKALQEAVDAASSAKETAEAAIVETAVLYALSNSPETAPASGWTAAAPAWTDGKYMWQKTVWTYGNGASQESPPTCLTGATGATGATGRAGADGVGIASAEVEYYLSTSATTLSGGAWQSAVPEITGGAYLWSRNKITYTNGAVEYTVAYCISKAMEETAQPLLEPVINRVSELAVTADGISARVSQQTQDIDGLKERMTAVDQDAESVKIQIQAILANGVDKVKTETGYTFNSDGLRISKSGEEMENKLDNTGMYVTRSGEVMLQANNAGVAATDVTVRNYLIVGTHARFEDYSGGRTACFYI